MYLYHYFEKGAVPFLSLSDLTDEEAIKFHAGLEAGDNIFARRSAGGQYIFQRRIVEKRMYSMFIKKGGKPQRKNPHYMILEEKELDECKAWFNNYDVVKIPIDEFDKDTVSFTYGDSFPTFEPIFEEKQSYNLYMYSEIWDVIKKQGMPPPRTADMFWLEPSYVEAQIWSDETVDKYRAFSVERTSK